MAVRVMDGFLDVVFTKGQHNVNVRAIMAKKSTEARWIM